MVAEYYKLVPKEPRENLAFRSWVCERAMMDPEVREDLRAMCARDLLFYINVFGWTHDPRINEFGRAAVPFITYPFQDDALLEIQNVLGRQDLCAAKSREMGASWMFLIVILHDWWKESLVSYLIASRTEDYVDKPGDPKTLFYKLVFFLEHLPRWLRPNYDKTRLHLENLDNGSTIDGTATTGDIGRGDRRKAILMDEYAAFSLQDGYEAQAASLSTTDCRLYNSTYKGPVGAFYDCSLLEIRQLRFEWFKHPRKRRGLYESKGGELIIKDHDFWNRATAGHIDKVAPLIRFAAEGPGALAINRYPFILDGEIRSPWFDNECKRTPIPSIIAEEVQMRPRGSGNPVFPAEKVALVEQEMCRPPTVIGRLVYDTETFQPIEFVETDPGSLRLWFNPESSFGGRPWYGRFVMGADISEGANASESAFSVADRETGEKVAEFADGRIDKITFAELFVAVSRWFCTEDEISAHKIWEANGPGRQFGDRVMQLDRNVFLRRKEDSLTRRPTEVPGWWATRDTKNSLFAAYWTALDRRLFVNRSKVAIRQLYRYQFGKDGSIVYPRTGDGLMDQSAKDSHGDRGTADALTWHAMGRIPDKTGLRPKTPEYSMARRKEKRRLATRQEIYW